MMIEAAILLNPNLTQAEALALVKLHQAAKRSAVDQLGQMMRQATTVQELNEVCRLIPMLFLF